MVLGSIAAFAFKELTILGLLQLGPRHSGRNLSLRCNTQLDTCLVFAFVCTASLLKTFPLMAWCRAFEPNVWASKRIGSELAVGSIWPLERNSSIMIAPPLQAKGTAGENLPPPPPLSQGFIPQRVPDPARVAVPWSCGPYIERLPWLRGRTQMLTPGRGIQMPTQRHGSQLPITRRGTQSLTPRCGTRLWH
jgi:hypothetical protein